MTTSTSRTFAAGILVLLAGGALTACGTDSDSPAPGPGIDQALIAELEARADRAVAAGIPGVVVVVRIGDQTVQIARGVSDLATGAAMTPAHRFRVASMAKSVVASVVLQLVHEGKLKLGDTLESWLPGMVPANKEVTIEQLLRQESGLFDYGADERLMAPYYQGNFEFSWTPEQLVGLSSDHPPQFAPGARFAYSNTNYTLLALIVQKITGRALADVVAERITRPLGLASTTMATGSQLDAPYAHGYLVGMGEPIDVTAISASSVFGAGNLVSTAGDLTILYGALVGGKIVSPGQLEAMFTLDPNIPPAKYGMGVFRFDSSYPCGAFVGHDGGLPGYDTVAYSRLDGRRQFAVLVNSMTAEEKAGDPQAHQAFAALIQAAACN